MAIPHFDEQLARYGPDATRAAPPVSLTEAQAYCRQLTRSHYENFTVASLLFPGSLRPHLFAIYAYCRWADDLADEVESSEKSLRLLAWWLDELQRCYRRAQGPADGLETSGVTPASHPVFVALEATIRQFSLPIDPFTDLISAFQQDQRQTRYESWDELLEYCRRSANPVGRLVLGLAECDEPRNRQWSDEICTGLQLTNFWQDVARDYERGRIYLPREAWRSVGFDEADFAARRSSGAFRRMLAASVERAEQHFRQGAPLVDHIPPWLRTDVSLFVRGGLAILTRIRRIDYDVWTQRPTLGRWSKLSLLLSAAWPGGSPGLPRRSRSADHAP